MQDRNKINCNFFKKKEKNKAAERWVALWEQIVVIYGLCRKKEAITKINGEFSPKCCKRQ